MSTTDANATPNTTGASPGDVASAEPTTPDSNEDSALLVMQIVVRRDLLDMEGWGVGPLMAQVAHASTAVLHETRNRPQTIKYLEELKSMRKVVLQVSDASALQKLSSTLQTNDIPHHLWIEQPENVPTCLALAPNIRDKPVKKALDKAGCRLWKG